METGVEVEINLGDDFMDDFMKIYLHAESKKDCLYKGGDFMESMGNLKRSNYCGEFSIRDVGKQ